MVHHHHGITGDFTTLGLLLVSNTPVILSATNIATERLQTVALITGIAASLVVCVDHVLKIMWKIKQRKKNKGGGDGTA